MLKEREQTWSVRRQARASNEVISLVFALRAPSVLLDHQLPATLVRLPEPVPLVHSRARVHAHDVLSHRVLGVPPPASDPRRPVAGKVEGCLDDHVGGRSAGDDSRLEDEGLSSDVVGRTGENLHGRDAAGDGVLEGEVGRTETVKGAQVGKDGRLDRVRVRVSSETRSGADSL